MGSTASCCQNKIKKNQADLVTAMRVVIGDKSPSLARVGALVCQQPGFQLMALFSWYAVYVIRKEGGWLNMTENVWKKLDPYKDIYWINYYQTDDSKEENKENKIDWRNVPKNSSTACLNCGLRIDIYSNTPNSGTSQLQIPGFGHVNFYWKACSSLCANVYTNNVNTLAANKEVNLFNQ
jgi:hypothetical protein